MPFIAYLARGFDHAHENESFENLFACLKAGFESQPGLHVLVGNICFEGNEMDAVFFKPDGIAILEIKNFGGEVSFYESTPWLVGGQQVIGGSRPNPLRQTHAYRIALRTWLRRSERHFMLAPTQNHWNHISAVVVFTRAIRFDASVLGNVLSCWFHVTDIPNIAHRLMGMHARSITLQDAETRLLLRHLGLTEAERYRPGVPATLPPLVASPAPPADQIQLNYVKEFDFREHELRMRNAAGSRLLAAQRVRQLFEEVRQGRNPFSTMPKRPDERIKGATIYPLNDNAELLLIQLGPFAIPAFLGPPHEVQAWLDSHTGLVVSIDEVTGRVSITRVNRQTEAARLQAPALTAENKPFLLRVTGIDLNELLPQELARQHVLALDETSTEIDIRQALELVFSEDLRRFLLDLILLISSGDTAGAEARIRLRNGLAVPAQDAGQFAEQAAASPVNSDQVLVINTLSKEELDRLLDPVNFQDWMLFLHPDQRNFADNQYDKPLVLKGVSGSGKTCILVHRARNLTKRYPGERIGILTLSDSLSGLLQNLVHRLCSPAERQHITIAPFYGVLRACLEHFGPEKYFAQLAAHVGPESHLHKVLRQAKHNWPHGMVWNCDPIRKDTADQQWEYFYMSQNPEVTETMDGLVKHFEEYRLDASRYLEEEFSLVRSAFTVPNRSDYLAPPPPDWRAGRTIPLTREKQRPNLLRLLLMWEEWLLAGGMIDALGLTHALMPLHNEMRALPDKLKFRCLLVDEFQDFSSLDLQLLRRIVPLDKPDALFIAGDPVQRILVKRLRYADAIIDEGPAIHATIRKNYRNSKQILRAASRVANHFVQDAGRQGEEVEILDPELAQRETSPPIVLKTDSQLEKAWEIALECMKTDGAAAYTVCIATAAPHAFPVATILAARPTGIKARALSGDCILHQDEVVVGTVQELKGFEFKLVLILGCDAGTFPPSGVPYGEIWREALRLYVAMTRARDQIFLLHQNDPSEFITIMGDAVILREEPLLKPYEREPAEPQAPARPIRAPQPAAPRPQPGRPSSPSRVIVPAADPNSRGIDWDENCETWFSELEAEALHRYFARHVFRDGLSFREWLKPRGLKMIQPALFYKVHKCPPTLVSAIIYKIEDKGIHLSRNPHPPYRR